MCSSRGSRASRPSPNLLQVHPDLVHTHEAQHQHQHLITHETLTLPVSPPQGNCRVHFCFRRKPHDSLTILQLQAPWWAPCLPPHLCSCICLQQLSRQHHLRVHRYLNLLQVRIKYFYLHECDSIISKDWIFCRTGCYFYCWCMMDFSVFIDCCRRCLLWRRGMVRWVWWLCWRDSSRFSIFSLIYFEITFCKYPLKQEFQNLLVYINQGKMQIHFRSCHIHNVYTNSSFIIHC